MFWQPAFRTVTVNAVIFSFLLNSQPIYPGFRYCCLSNCMHTVKSLIKTDTNSRFMQVFNTPEENWKDEFVYKPINGKISKSYFPLTRSCLKRVFSCSSRTIFLIKCVVYLESLHHAFKTNWCMISLLLHHISSQGNEPQSVDKSCQNEPIKGHTRIWYTRAKAICPAARKGIKKTKRRAVENLENFYRIPFPSLLKVFYLYLELPCGQENTNGFTAWQLRFLGNGLKSTQFQHIAKFLCGPNLISQACFHVG